MKYHLNNFGVQFDQRVFDFYLYISGFCNCTILIKENQYYVIFHK